MVDLGCVAPLVGQVGAALFGILFVAMSNCLEGGSSSSSSLFESSLLDHYYRYDEDAAVELMDNYTETVQEPFGDYYRAYFNYQTNLTEYNSGKRSNSSIIVAMLQHEVEMEALRFNLTSFSPATQRRFEAFLYLSRHSPSGGTMAERYVEARVCKTDDVCLTLEPDLTRVMADSRNYNELYWAWDGWRAVTGHPSREDFIHLVDQQNLMAVWYYERADVGDFQRSKYEIEDLDVLVVDLYSELEELYKHLHAYVRRKLYQFYGPDYINIEGPLPAHLLGNMWAQNWINIFDIVDPYPRNTSDDISSILKEKNLRPEDFYRTAEEFFLSLGLLKTPQSFWEESMFEKPTDGREVICHASAWDFLNQEDFRVSMCGDQTYIDFLIAHHEMGHIQYYMQYADQPVELRQGANPAFHEALGDCLALSVSTPKHLHAIGLSPATGDDYESDIRYLVKKALHNVAYLPYGILVDLWRWEIFANTTAQEEYNDRWWELRLQYQGIIPPTPRTEKHFDPASKWHIANGTPYIRYFLSNIIMFQFHKALCNASGHVGPLFKCDIYKSKEAGKLLSDMLKLGSSEHWTVAMETLTGQREISTGPMLEYFQPLLDWLKKENKDETVGWETADNWRPKPPDLLYSIDSTAPFTREVSHILAILITCLHFILR